MFFVVIAEVEFMSLIQGNILIICFWDLVLVRISYATVVTVWLILKAFLLLEFVVSRPITQILALYIDNILYIYIYINFLICLLSNN